MNIDVSKGAEFAVSSVCFDPDPDPDPDPRVALASVAFDPDPDPDPDPVTLMEACCDPDPDPVRLALAEMLGDPDPDPDPVLGLVVQRAEGRRLAVSGAPG